MNLVQKRVKWEEPWCWSQSNRIWISIPLYTCCVIMDTFLNFSKPQSPHSKIGMIRCMWKLNEILHINLLTQYILMSTLHQSVSLEPGTLINTSWNSKHSFPLSFHVPVSFGTLLHREEMCTFLYYSKSTLFLVIASQLTKFFSWFFFPFCNSKR